MVDASIGRCFWIAALALAACSSDDDAASNGSGASEGESSSTGVSNPPLGGDEAQICQAYADRIEACGEEFHWAPFYAVQGYGYCAADLHAAAGLGFECSTAHEDYYACLSGLECAAFEDVSAGCRAAKETMAIACGGASDSSSSSGGSTG